MLDTQKVACKTFSEYVKYDQPIPKEILYDIVDFIEYMKDHCKRVSFSNHNPVIEQFLHKIDSGS